MIECEMAVDFLTDWKGEAHRPLGESARGEVGRYINAIVRRDEACTGSTEMVRTYKSAMLWRTFREAYDDLRPPFKRSEAEDIRRVMGRL